MDASVEPGGWVLIAHIPAPLVPALRDIAQRTMPGDAEGDQAAERQPAR
jgi:hypothetical protein